MASIFKQSKLNLFFISLPIKVTFCIASIGTIVSDSLPGLHTSILQYKSKELFHAFV